jgi:hypothetical protein
MSISFHRQMLPLVSGVLLSLCAVQPVWASGEEDLYRCRVMGDPRDCERLPMSTGSEAVTKIVPGSYARYLIHNGRPVEQAISEARSVGEEAVLQVVNRDLPRQLGALESYERYVRGGPALGHQRDSNVVSRDPRVVR